MIFQFLFIEKASKESGDEIGMIPKAFSQIKLQTLEIHFRGEDYIPKELCEAIGQMENLKTFHLTCDTDKSDINALFKVLKEFSSVK